jgi:hypothetical protein
MGVVKGVPWLLGERTVATMAIVTNHESLLKVCLSQGPLYIYIVI